MKILILTASPERDAVIDEQICEILNKRGHTTEVAPCLREGRDAVLKFKPNVCVIPPIRNVYSRDFVQVLKSWNVGVVTRHTEASCDWQDWKKISRQWKEELLGRFKYIVDAEIVWGEDEKQILDKRNCPFPVYAVGAMALDVYFRKDLDNRFGTREKFNEERKLDNNKKTLLIGSPWGFADSAPDLQIPEIPVFNRDAEWRDIQLGMIKRAKLELGDKWNILMRPHPGVLMEPYQKFAKENNIPLDSSGSAACRTLYHTDALIHAGSTMAMEMHVLDKPSFQFGNVNQKHPKNWWLVEDTPMSQISPIFKDVDTLLLAVKTCKIKSNANKDALKKLETGRYGKMDGKATKRCADIIEKVSGKFKMCWPLSPNNYEQLTVVREVDRVIAPAKCGICKNNFLTIKMDWLKQLAMSVKLTQEQKFMIQAHNSKCPWCGSTFFRSDMTI